MKKFLLIALIAFGVKVKAQYILAGVHGVQDYYHDIMPDKLLHAQNSQSSFHEDSLLIDINNDNINDFKIAAVDDAGGNWWHFDYFSVTPLNNNIVAMSGFDSCFANCPPPSYLYRKPMADSLSLNDSINNNNLWIDSASYLVYGGWNASIPNGCGYGCNNNTLLSNSTKYLGVGVSVTSGILFGWIKLKRTTDSIIVEEYACNLIPLSSVNEFKNNFSMDIYPNPTNNSTRIDYTFPIGVNEGEIIFYDMQGKEIKRFKVDRTFDHLLISTSDIPAGTYFFQLKTSGQNSAGKKMVVIK